MNEDNRSGGSGEGRRPWWAIGCSPTMARGDRRNLRRFNALLFLWLVTFAGTLAVLRLQPDGLGAWRFVVAATPALFLLVALLAYIKFIREADELTRKIQLESLAFGFGAGFWVMFGYSMLVKAGAPPLDTTDASMAMVFAYMVSVAMAQKRYA